MTSQDTHKENIEWRKQSSGCLPHGSLFDDNPIKDQSLRTLALQSIDQTEVQCGAVDNCSSWSLH
jgi:hypothetical protein